MLKGKKYLKQVNALFERSFVLFFCSSTFVFRVQKHYFKDCEAFLLWNALNDG